MLSICSEDRHLVTHESETLVANVNRTLAEYCQDLLKFATNLEELSDEYDAVWKKHKGIRAGGYTGGILGSLLGIAGGTVAVATGGMAIPFLVGGLLIGGTVVGVAGGITRLANEITTDKRMKNLSKKFETLIADKTDSYDCLVAALKQLQGSQQLENTKMKTMFGSKANFLQGSGEVVGSTLVFFPSFRDLVKTGLANSFKLKPASGLIATSVAGVTDEIVGTGTKVAGQTAAKESVKRAAFAAGGVTIGLGVLALGYEIYEIVQDSKKDDCTFSQELRALVRDIREKPSMIET